MPAAKRRKLVVHNRFRNVLPNHIQSDIFQWDPTFHRLAFTSVVAELTRLVGECAVDERCTNIILDGTKCILCARFCCGDCFMECDYSCPQTISSYCIDCSIDCTRCGGALCEAARCALQCRICQHTFCAHCVNDVDDGRYVCLDCAP
jgi:hypothetical protein